MTMYLERLQDEQRVIDALGGALVRADGLPEFSYETSETKYGDMFYALLRSNTSHETIQADLGQLALDGSFAGVGFATSLYCVLRFFSQDFSHAFFCEREPYVYLTGKVILKLIQDVTSGPELLLSILDYDSFYAAYTQVVEAESDESPIFLRLNREQMLLGMPEGVEQVRRGVFSTRHNKLSKRERELFLKECTTPVGDKLAWVKHFALYKSYYTIERLYFDFEAIQDKLRGRTTALCVDMFHEDLWKFLGSFTELWQRPSMVHFANAAVYSKGADIRKEQFCVSHDYSAALPAHLPGAEQMRHYFLYTIRHEHYEVKWSTTIPSIDDLLESFRPKKKAVTHAPVVVESKPAPVAKKQQPVATKPASTFRLNPGSRGTVIEVASPPRRASRK